MDCGLREEGEDDDDDDDDSSFFVFWKECRAENTPTTKSTMFYVFS